MLNKLPPELLNARFVSSGSRSSLPQVRQIFAYYAMLDINDCFELREVFRTKGYINRRGSVLSGLSANLCWLFSCPYGLCRSELLI